MSKQFWNPETYARNSWDSNRNARNSQEGRSHYFAGAVARFVSDLGQGLLEALTAQRGERVLDLGCGDGALSEKLVAAGCRVVAVDSSAEQVAAARLRGLDTHVYRAESLPFEEEFDAVFSNAVLHWIPNVKAVLSSVHRALRPGGRFVAEMGGAGNVSTIRAALTAALERRGIDAAPLNPWVFPTAAEYRRHLEARGFNVRMIELFARPTVLPGDLADWLQTFAQPFLAPVVDDDRRQLIEEVCDAVRGALYRDQQWVADYVRLRFIAERGP